MRCQVTDVLANQQPLASVTYPQFFATPQEKLQLIYRTGGSGNGDWHLAEYSPEASKWDMVGKLFSATGEFQGSQTRCSYPNQFRYGPGGRIHTTWCWREEPSLATNHDVCYAYSDDFGRDENETQITSITSLPIHTSPSQIAAVSAPSPL